MMIAFILTMPHVNSWNGKWSGEGMLHARVKKFGRSKAEIEHAKKILGTGVYYYDFGDGWGAQIEAKLVSSSEAAKICKKTSGFAGYDWMIDQIIRYPLDKEIRRKGE